MQIYSSKIRILRDVKNVMQCKNLNDEKRSHNYYPHVTHTTPHDELIMREFIADFISGFQKVSFNNTQHSLP